MRVQSYFKSFISILLSTIFVLSTVLILPPNLESKADMSSVAGELAVGSPLCSQQFALDDWNYWEMLAFGVFISNFCTPFEDDYNSAFTSGSSLGSKGRGLAAMKFATGGDAESEGYLRDMLNYCKDTQKTTYKKIFVKYHYYEYNEDVGTAAGGQRDATIGDLFPVLSISDNSANREIASINAIKRPVVYYSMLKPSKNSGGSVGETIMDMATLPEFYVDGKTAPIFSLCESWDVNMLKAIVAKYMESEGVLDNKVNELNKCIENNYPIVLDNFGNICMVKDGRTIVVIPACVNSHITTVSSYNYLNSMIINNFVVTDYDSDVCVSTGMEKLDGGDKAKNIFAKFFPTSGVDVVGNNPVSILDDTPINIETGRILLGVDTLPLKYWDIYTELKSKGNPKDFDASLDINSDPALSGSATTKAKRYGNHAAKYTEDAISSLSYGHYYNQLLDEKSDEHQRLQIFITGYDTKIETNKKQNINTSDSVAEAAYGAYSLISYAVSTTTSNQGTSENILNYFYNLERSNKWEQTKTKLLRTSAYYLTPDLDVDKTIQKYYVNYAMRMLTGIGGLKSYGFDSAWAENYAKNELDTAKDAKSAWITLFTPTKTESSSASKALANPMYRSFLKENTTADDNTLNTNSLTLSTIKGKNWTMSESFQNRYKSKAKKLIFFEKHPMKLAELNPITKISDEKFQPRRIVKIYEVDEKFRQIADVYSLSNSASFDLLITQIYVTYLKFYGILDGGGKKHGKFDEGLFDKASFKTFTADNFNSGLTKEEREEQTKLNVYRLLSLSNDGEKYRNEFFDSVLKSLIVVPLDKELNGDTVGNVGASGNLLNIHSLEDTIVVGHFVTGTTWKNMRMIFLAIVILLCILSGALNARSFTWYIAITVANVLMVISIPFYVDLAPQLISKYVEVAYNDGGTYWALLESIKYNENSMRVTSEGEAADQDLQAILDVLTFLDADNTLMLKMDISQKVISLTPLTYEDLQLPSLRWVLPSLTKQISSKTSSTDEVSYVSIPTSSFYENAIRLWIRYTGDKAIIPSGSNLSDFATETLDDSYQKSAWTGYISIPYTDTYRYSRPSSWMQHATVLPHTSFYYIKALTIHNDDRKNNKGRTYNEWIQYGKDIAQTHESKDVGTKEFNDQAQAMLAALNDYNKYEDDIDQSYGFLWTTENLSYYFYLIAKESLSGELILTNENSSVNTSADTNVNRYQGEESEQNSTTEENQAAAILRGEQQLASDKVLKSTANTATVMMFLQGSTSDVEVNGNTTTVRKSFMHDSKGNVRDVCDMQEVFTNLMPYMYQVMVLAGGDGATSGLVGAEKMTGHPYYRNNYLSWMFRSNWVTKLYEDINYTATFKGKNKDGGAVEVTNIIDPLTYSGRPMIFSEAQLADYANGSDFGRGNLTLVENKILDFNEQVVDKWTALINYANLAGLEPEDIYRQMALDATFTFNEVFAKDNLIMKENTLHPLQYDLRTISQISVLRSMISNFKKNSTYASGNLAEKLYENDGLAEVIGLRIILFSWGLFAIFRELGVIFIFVLACICTVVNMLSIAKEKMKTILGCCMTSLSFGLLTLFYYWVLKIIIGKPIIDTIVDVDTVLTAPNRFSVLGWSIIIALLTLAYTITIICYILNLFVWKRGNANWKDGGFGFFENVAEKTASTINATTAKIGDKLGLVNTKLTSFGPGAVYDDAPSSKGSSGRNYGYGSGGRNDDYDQENGGKPRKKRESDARNAYKDDKDMVEGPVSSGDNPKLTNTVNEAIRSRKQEASSENRDRVTISTSQNTDSEVHLYNGQKEIKIESNDKELTVQVDNAIKSSKEEKDSK